MSSFDWKQKIRPYDDRRDIIIPGDEEETVAFCTRQWIQIGQEAISKRGQFAVALSGGHTPNAIFKELSKPENIKSLDWSKVLCFWSDERSVPPTDPESNYHAAMQAGFATLPLKPENIFRMQGEGAIEEHAKAYEELIRKQLPSFQFDLIMLGMGEDGHTASLFPHTEGLHAAAGRLVIANFVPQKNTWRMSFTYECIQQGKVICIYAMGSKKAAMVAKVLTGSYEPDLLPIQRIGTPDRPATWILDTAASAQLPDN